MGCIRFTINLSVESYRHYYSGHARFIQVQGHDGRRLRFPAEKLRPYLSHRGVYGEFELEFDENNKFISLRRCSEPGL
ncbi:MAG: DUF2835 domain-containing protein [Gammaproteobacteria bacterium]|nr:DUF2835 domain-containing protein [Gammaproteobacteria bacterium]